MDKCSNCFHYNACSAVDTEGYMLDKSPEFYEDMICPNYIDMDRVARIFFETLIAKIASVICNSNKG